MPEPALRTLHSRDCEGNEYRPFSHELEDYCATIAVMAAPIGTTSDVRSSDSPRAQPTVPDGHTDW